MNPQLEVKLTDTFAVIDVKGAGGGSSTSGIAHPCARAKRADVLFLFSGASGRRRN
jgi:hypothetical protein